MKVISAFAIVNAVFGNYPYMYVATEGGILRINLNTNTLEWAYPFRKVEHVAYSLGNVLFVSEGVLYRINDNASYHERAFNVAFVGNVRRIGVDERGNVVLEYSGRKKALDSGGFERSIFGKVKYEGVKGDGSIEKNAFLKPSYIYDKHLGKVSLNFLYEYNYEWFVGTDGLGLLVYARNSSIPKRSYRFGTYNTLFSSAWKQGNYLILGGDKGIDILHGEDILSFRMECTPVRYVFKVGDWIYVLCDRYAYRMDLYGNAMSLANITGYLKAKLLMGEIFVIFKDRILKLISGEELQLRDPIDVVEYKDMPMILLKRMLVSFDGSFSITIDMNDWIDSRSLATNLEGRIAICTKFGIMLYDEGRWIRKAYSLGNVSRCYRYGGRLGIVSQGRFMIYDPEDSAFRQMFHDVKGIVDVLDGFVVAKNYVLKRN